MKNLLTSLRSSVSKGSTLSLSSKKVARRKLRYVLWFDQMPYKRFLVKLQKFVSLSLNVDISDAISWVVRNYEEIALDQGPVEAAKLFKQLHDIYIRISTSHYFEVPPFLKRNSKGEPSLLGPLLELSKGSAHERKAGLHAIQVIKLVGVQDSSFSTDSITKAPPIEMLPLDSYTKPGQYMARYIEKFGTNIDGVDLNRLRRCYLQALEEAFPWNGRQKRLDAISKESSIHFSGRNGPNGPCLTTVVLDHGSLAPLQGSLALYGHIRNMAILTKNMTLLRTLIGFEEEPYLWKNDNKDKPINSRLSIKDEAWAKRRVFAICDWFSQSSLKGFHSYLFRWLEAQSEDGTFDQDRVSEVVRLWTTGPDPLKDPESADLSAATDSIPVEIQSEIVNQIAGREFSKLWRNICCDRDFKVPNSVDTVRYATGQPMGILSSWAVLAVWHHIMCRTCLKYLGVSRKPSSPDYVVIGDDVAMKGADLFSIYRTLVGTVQGVGISKTKGYHKETFRPGNELPSGVSERHVVAEFAKRIFCSGIELSVIPPDEIKTSFESPSQFPELLVSMTKRGYPELDHHVLPSLTSLCLHKKLALLLSTSPVCRCPRRVTPVPTELDLYGSLPWYKPGFDEVRFKRNYIKLLQGSLISVLAVVLGRINQWIAFSVQAQETKVKAWRYESMTQLELLRVIAQRLAGVVSLSDEKIYEAFTSLDLNLAKRALSNLQVIFEIDHLFKEKNISKHQAQKHFLNKLVEQAVKRTLSETES